MDRVIRYRFGRLTTRRRDAKLFRVSGSIGRRRNSHYFRNIYFLTDLWAARRRRIRLYYDTHAVEWRGVRVAPDLGRQPSGKMVRRHFILAVPICVRLFRTPPPTRATQLIRPPRVPGLSLAFGDVGF